MAVKGSRTISLGMFILNCVPFSLLLLADNGHGLPARVVSQEEAYDLNRRQLRSRDEKIARHDDAALAERKAVLAAPAIKALPI